MSATSTEPLPFFKTITKSFKDVPTEPGVDTAQFCEASEGLVKFFDLFGNPAFSVVQNDLTGNIAKTRARLASHPAQSGTLEDLIKGEKGEKKKTATEGLMWLLRGLKFTYLGLKSSLDNPTEEMSVSFTKAYEGSLKPHHGMLVRPVFYLAMKACPYRATFYPKLGSPESEVKSELEAWLQGLDKILTQMEGVYKSGGYGTV